MNTMKPRCLLLSRLKIREIAGKLVELKKKGYPLDKFN